MLLGTAEVLCSTALATQVLLCSCRRSQRCKGMPSIWMGPACLAVGWANEPEQVEHAQHGRHGTLKLFFEVFVARRIYR